MGEPRDTTGSQAHGVTRRGSAEEAVVGTVKKGGRPPKSVDPTEVAAIIAFADLHSEGAAAKRFGVSGRAIQRWKLALKEGRLAEVARLVAQTKLAVLDANADLLDETFAATMRALQKKLEDPTNTLRAIVGALKISGELKLQRDFLRDDDGKPTGVHPARAGSKEAASDTARGEGGATDPAGGAIPVH